MSAEGADVVETASLGSVGGRAGDYLLCIDGERSWRVPVVLGVELTIGRGAGADVALVDPLVSRRHARCVATLDGVRLIDLESRHGTLVNGERFVGARFLRSGDVVTIGDATLVLHRSPRTASRVLVERDALVRRLEDELDRARHYGREVAVLVARADAAFDPARVTLALTSGLPPVAMAATLGAHHVVVVAPELGGARARALAAQLGGVLAAGLGPVAIGLACGPGDGIAADGLLAAARGAADAAAPGAIVEAAAQVPQIEAGDRRIIVAELGVAKLYELAARLARSPLPILIEGETGVGKEVAAAAIHGFSRRTGAFVAVNCAAVPEALAESEWFGHARGAFTGAHAARAGYFEQASGGTLFLDELGELPLALQAKMLRVLEVGEVVRVGEAAPRRIDLRIVAATNRELADEVRGGRFRQDLYFRIGAARLVLPPLRDRPRDLAVLCRCMLADACAAMGRPPLALSVAATYALLSYAWPGNVRELKNVIGYVTAATPDDVSVIERDALPADVTAVRHDVPGAAPAVEAIARAPGLAPAASGMAPSGGVTPPSGGVTPPAGVAPPPSGVMTPPSGVAPPASGMVSPASGRSVADDVRALERGRMVAAMRATGGQRTRAAAMIEMPVRTFTTKLKRYEITADDWQVPPP